MEEMFAFIEFFEVMVYLLNKDNKKKLTNKKNYERYFNFRIRKKTYFGNAPKRNFKTIFIRTSYI